MLVLVKGAAAVLKKSDMAENPESISPPQNCGLSLSLGEKPYPTVLGKGVHCLKNRVNENREKET